jgi:C-terminal processing protease CtpA/Prc
MPLTPRSIVEATPGATGCATRTGPIMKRTSRALGLIVTLCGGLATAARGDDSAQPPTEQIRVQRLARLAELWGTIRYYHPALAYRDLDWDAPLVKAIPQVSAAKTKADYAGAVRELLAALGDPATALVPQAAAGTMAEGERHPAWSRLEDKILVVRLNNYADIERDFVFAYGRMQSLKAEIARSEGVVFDIRALKPGSIPGIMTAIFDPIGSAIVWRELVGPAGRSVVHSGYVPQTGMTSGGYYSAFTTTAATRFVPERGAKMRRVAFVVNARSELPPLALALQGTADGAIVAEGPISDALFVTTTVVDLGEGLAARVRTADFVGPNGPVELSADVEVAAATAPGAPTPAIEAALKFVRGGLGGDKPTRAAKLRPAVFVQRLDRPYAEMEYPAKEYRLLAAFRFWNVIRLFFPYKHLIGEDWDAVLVEFIPKFEAARDAREYALALAELATHTHDSHVSVRAAALTEFFGTASPGIALREIEGEIVVTRLGSSGASKAAGVAVGDIVLKVDGEAVRDRMRRLGTYLTASTPQAHTLRILGVLLSGPAGSKVALTIRDREGRERELSLERDAGGITYDTAGGGDVMRLLEGNIGYADLRRLTVGQVDSMFERFQQTRGIIFDMRGYPQGTAWAIAPRINTNKSHDAAEFRRALVGGEHLPPATFLFRQEIPPAAGKPLYRGKTVMLIDERAISQSEHTGLFFEAANGTTFIGSPTMGANGDVTMLTVPGGITISFSGHDVRHADGRQLQRVGLVPHVEVRPTIQGIRDGRDEVLERAVEFLKAH